MPDPSKLPDYQAVCAAAKRIAPWIHHTPVLTSASLNELVGAQLFFKCENFQKTGAFKSRGACNAIFSLPDTLLEAGVATHSSGNHGAALARAARLRGAPAYIVIPRGANAAKRAAVEAYGGKIIESEPSMAKRLEKLQQVIKATGAHSIPPYDDARIIAGQGTAALEFLDQQVELDIMITPVGGGGLLAGSGLAVQGCSQNCQVFGAEPAGADDARQSLRAGKIMPVSQPDTIADGLRATLGELPLLIIQRLARDIVTVDDAAIIRAMRLIWERLKILVEPSAAVALAVVLERRVPVANKRVGIILSGGNVDMNAVLPWQKNDSG